MMIRLSLPLFFVALLVFLAAQAVLGLASTSSSPKKVAVVGATGKLGRVAVQQLVDQGVACNLLLRKDVDPGVPVPSSISSTSSKEDVIAYLSSLKGVTVVKADLGNVESLKGLLKDCDACLALYGSTRRSRFSDMWNSSVEDSDPTHAKQVNYQGVANLVAAAKDVKKCRRIVRITGKGEDPTGIFSVLINMLGSMAKAWNYEGERVLRSQDDVEYTIVRPGIMMSDDDNGGPSQGKKVLALKDDGGDLPVSKIRYADIAALCIASLSYPNAGRSTLTAMTVEEGQGASSWSSLLEKVGPDRRSFPSDMLQRHKDAVKGAVIKLGVVATLIAALIVQVLLKFFSAS